MKKEKGFTLLEMISVITIIVMIAIIVVPIIDKNIKEAQNIASDSQVEMIEEAAFIYAIKNRSSLSTLDQDNVATITIGNLVNAGLLEEKKLKTVSNQNIPLTDIVVIVISEEMIKTVYDKEQEGNPIILLKGPQKLNMVINTSYTELGASLITLSPNTITDLSLSNIQSNVDNTNIGTYSVVYSYPNAKTVTRTVVVSTSSTSVDNQKPIIEINGSSTINISKGSVYTDQGATATDNKDGDITSRIVTTGTVNTNQKGTYYIKYNVTDSSGNKAETAIRTIIVN